MASSNRPPPDNIPVYRIDLSLPPRERYKALAIEYKPQIASITPLFNQLLADLGIPEGRHGTINTLARLVLRGLYSPIETAEIRGISEVTGVDMYLLVALNVVLDLLMGCTSSTVRSDLGGVWHLRTLDWGMDPLRDIIVRLDFVRSRNDPAKYAQTTDGSQDDEVIASSITYVGFVGVLTGVRRPGLSMSLNFRAMHNASTRLDNFRFYAHHLAVLLGYRQSISSILRELLFDDHPKPTSRTPPPNLEFIEKGLSSRHTTAAYLVFCDGNRSVAMEKDFSTSNSRWDKDGFLVATNHDFENANAAKDATPVGNHAAQLARREAMADLLDDSAERAECISAKWKKKARRRLRSSTRGDALGLDEAVEWVSDWPTTNETTHFATVMDAGSGTIQWAHAYHEPVREPTK